MTTTTIIAIAIVYVCGFILDYVTHDFSKYPWQTKTSFKNKFLNAVIWPLRGLVWAFFGLCAVAIILGAILLAAWPAVLVIMLICLVL